MSKRPTPGPWVAQSRDDGKSDPWWIDTHAYPDGPEPVWAPPQYPVSEADVALICEAVNNYDRLKKIEAAARKVVTWTDDGGLPSAWPNASGLHELRMELEIK